MVPIPETLSDLDFSASALREASLQAARHFIQPDQGIAFVLISKANVDLVFMARAADGVLQLSGRQPDNRLH